MERLENKTWWIINVCWCGRHSSFVLQASLAVVNHVPPCFLCHNITALHFIHFFLLKLS